MLYKSVYSSPMGDMLIACDDGRLTGLWFFGSKYFADGISQNAVSEQTPVMREVFRWLDIYFSGKNPGAAPPVGFAGSPFQLDVWEELCKIPYGQTVTYGSIAKAVAQKKGLGRMSAQAVGNAVGRNRISIIVPCHRVVGADGSLCGYAGGLDIKAQLLQLENIK